MNRRDTALVQKAQRGSGRHVEVARRAPTANRELANEVSIANGLLAALPHATYQRLVAGLETVTLKFGDVLHEPGMPIRYVYFPVNCVISLLTAVTGHQPLKVGLVGHEGMVGSALVLGINASCHRALVQGTGIAMRMESAPFRKAVLQSKPWQQALYRYKHALLSEIGQSAACNQFHPVLARLACYLLATGDCARSSEIRLTHEFLARMLGVRRVGITLAAGTLQKTNLIKCGHGKITILDRERLRAASCECYRIIKRIYGNSAVADG